MGACLGSCLATCACEACCKACGCKCLLPPIIANTLYCLLFFVATIAALILRYNEAPLRICLGFSDCEDTDGYWTSKTSYSYDLCGGDDCAGQWAAFRISFALTCFFGTLFVFTTCKTACSVYVHRGFWIGKVLAFAAVLFATLFMPNDVFAYFAWVARFVAPGFLVYQMIFFIDFGYRVNTKLVEWDEPATQRRFLCSDNEDGVWFKRLLLFISLACFLATFAGVGLLFHYFHQGCQFNPLAISLTLILLLINTVISVSKIAPHGAIFTSALMSVYTMWLTYTAMSSMPYEECNPLFASPTPIQTAISIAIASISIFGTAFNAGFRENRRALNFSGKGTNDQVTVDVPPPDGEVEPASFWTYHLVMLLLSMYMSMLLTNWGQSNDDATLHSSGVASAWVQLGSSWLCSLIYFWTLVAPALFPDRDFS
eukprot:CAMPEP_0183353442 /NCGR_PEP_ID=MMETSP0164_2-20130417/33256_1 /TAXON_ID=221442 /ORGANISM="Coccolithus pelagicus ssp braarudi, Strain PLY182g" /LENGTH=427 /DNA_ID=CAMNT_0025526111 /DNA_START=11 /DNA_END=1294 /DNA_ORIENTATION=-